MTSEAQEGMATASADSEQPTTALPEEEGDDFLVIGLDGEMSSADLASGGWLIQAGFAASRPGGIDILRSGIGWPSTVRRVEWSPRAEQVHGITRQQVDAFPPAGEVDDLAYQWLLQQGAQPGRRGVVTVGFNVMAFDHPFFREALPKTMSLISRRGIDLNAVCFTLHGWSPDGQPWPWTAWKRRIKAEAASRLQQEGITGQEHDAGYDAALALAGWQWARQQVHACRAKAQQPGDLAARILGSGLAGRLAILGPGQLRELAAAFLHSGQEPGKWMGKPRSDLGGRSGLQACIDGDVNQVINLVGTHDA